MPPFESPTPAAIELLMNRMMSGSRTALSRILTRVENHRETSGDILRQLPARGHALRIGFTGPPGAGKSTLVSSYIKSLRKLQQRVCVLAVDPTSPFSGGALLGDRVRMNAVALDENVFVRSLATRGDLGGLAEAAGDMADVFDAVGFDYILYETVGVGQSELEIAHYADCTVVVLVPESGDAIQGMKAGLMEIADIFVINKADREGANRFIADLQAVMQFKDWGDWLPSVVMTVAVRDQGIEEFHAQVVKHIEFLRASGQLVTRRAQRTRRRIRRLVEQKVMTDFWTASRLNELEKAIAARQSPYEISQQLLAGLR
jgi:LAO/AO transport system kinase